MAAADELEMPSFDGKTAFINLSMKHDVYVQQVSGFGDQSHPHVV